MTVPDQHGKAEELAVEAIKYLGQEGGSGTAAVRAALAQVYATLAVAAAIEATVISRGRPGSPGRSPALDRTSDDQRGRCQRPTLLGTSCRPNSKPS